MRGEETMHAHLIAAGLATMLAATPALAQTQANKPETNCTPSASSAPSGSGQTTGSTGNSMSIDKNAILPSAGGHANSAAPTVQKEGQPMQVRPDCPPDQAKSK
jgi:hypothetical protein